MPLRSSRFSLGRRLFLTLATLLGVLSASRASAITAYVLTDNRALVVYDTSNTGAAQFAGLVSGILPGEEIEALDVRPRTARLYAVTRLRLYVLDVTASGARAIPVSTTSFQVPLTGGIGMDFDPVTDRIRVVTSTGQNWRLHPEHGVVTMDAAIAPSAAIGAIAYTRNHSTTDRATLYGIDDTSHRLVRIGALDAADGGASQALGAVTPAAAATGFTGEATAFDILANDNRALVVARATSDAASSTMYLVDLTTGAGTPLYPIDLGIRALAVYSRPTIMHALTSDHTLIRFSTVEPDVLLGPAQPITGLSGGETIQRIDMGTATGEIYGVSNAQRIFTLNPATGAATLVGAVPAGLITSPIAAIEFTWSGDTLDVMSTTNEVARVHIPLGVGAAGPTRSIPNIVGLATMPYGPAFTNLDGMFRTYGIDSTGRFINFSRLTGVPLAMPAPLTGELTGFDITRVDGMAYVSATPTGATASTLYAVDLENGPALPIGEIGGGATIRDITAVNTSTFRFDQFAYNVTEGAGSLAITVMRDGGADGPATVRVDLRTGTNGATSAITERTIYVDFVDGQTSRTVTVPVYDDLLDEPNEDVLMTMTPPAFTSETSGLVLIMVIDDDPMAGDGSPFLLVTTPTRDASYTATSTFVTLAGEAADPLGAITTVSWTTDRGASGVASIGPSLAHVDWIADDIPLSPGANVITVTALDNLGNASTKTLTVSLNELSYYLAEGATGGFFDLDLLLANPHAEPVTVTARFLQPGGQGTVLRQYELAPRSRLTVPVEQIPGLEAAEVSTIVTTPATHPIVVERTMRWDETGYGAHTDKAHQGAALRWYFAEGAQGFFSTYLLLANPQANTNVAWVTFLRENAPAITTSYIMAPYGRYTADLGANRDLVNQSFGMEVTFAEPGIAERAMYFGSDPLWEGGHESMGVTQPSRQWFLAEGATGPFFETFVLLANPSATTATAQVRYLVQGGAALTRSYQVPARGRRTINLEAEDPALTNAAVATEVLADVPLIVERAQYWPDPAPMWHEAHNSFGVTSLAPRWGLAEGRVGGDADYQTYVLLANPQPVAAEVTIEFLRETGPPVTKVFTVPMFSRLNVSVAGEVPEIGAGNFGAVITSTQPIAAERAMYSNAESVVWRAGTNATATRLP